MMKRAFDFLASLFALAVLSPVFLAIAAAVWLGDFRNPFYYGRRMARGGWTFPMIKFRTMNVDAWKSGVYSTAAGDSRVTSIGQRLRRAKLDELPQFVNVFLGHMSLVGPRPQVPSDAALYTSEERRILTARPGITDLASIVFADESAILAGSADPDLLYNRIIRPWKSRLALLYIERRTFFADLRILLLTALALVSRDRALRRVAILVEAWGGPPLLIRMARRKESLIPYPPPGAAEAADAARASP